MSRAAVIGAGAAGLACARALQQAGLATVVFEKARGPGGRIATKRFDTPLGPAQADHGAQYFTARDPVFAAAMAGLGPAVARWDARFEPAGRDARLVGAPRMSAIGRALADGLEVRLGVRVAAVERAGAGWRFLDEGGAVLIEAERVVVAAPAEQAAPLLAPIHPAFAALAAAARTAPSWAAMCVFDRPLDLGFDGRSFEAGPIAWAARDSAKPGRGGLETWVLHAARDWSAAHLEEAPEAVGAKLAAAFAPLSGAEPAFVLAHRWRYAFVERAAGQDCLWDAGAGVGACGDWLLGPRVEFAWRSGAALGAAITRG